MNRKDKNVTSLTSIPGSSAIQNRKGFIILQTHKDRISSETVQWLCVCVNVCVWMSYGKPARAKLGH